MHTHTHTHRSWLYVETFNRSICDSASRSGKWEPLVIKSFLPSEAKPASWSNIAAFASRTSGESTQTITFIATTYVTRLTARGPSVLSLKRSHFCHTSAHHLIGITAVSFPAAVTRNSRVRNHEVQILISVRELMTSVVYTFRGGEVVGWWSRYHGIECRSRVRILVRSGNLPGLSLVSW